MITPFEFLLAAAAWAALSLFLILRECRRLLRDAEREAREMERSERRIAANG